MNAAKAHESNAAEQFLAAKSGNAQALDSLVQENLPLVKFVVKRFLGRGKEYDDLFQTGCIGLIKAIRKFDPQYGSQFSTYAVPLIMGEIRRLLRDDNSIHISRSLHDISSRIIRFCQDFESEQGDEPSIENICEALGVDRETVLMGMNAVLPVRSLAEPLQGRSDLTLEETLTSDHIDKIDERLMLQDIFDRLNHDEKALILARYFERRTQSEIGQRIGKTQVQVSRMESKLIARLRNEFNGYMKSDNKIPKSK